MKFTVVQPHYGMTGDPDNQCFQTILHLLDECDGSSDVIVLPEDSNFPYQEKDHAVFERVARANQAVLLDHVKKTAIRCRAKIFCNCYDYTPTGPRNTTFVFDENGEIVGKYYKAHPAPSEVRTVKEGGYGMDVSYSYEYSTPYVLTLDGVRYAFMTCYDFYFYENFARIARENVDVIIGCSLQRTDTPQALEIIGQFLCYQTNAYLVRASMSLAEDSPVSGCSMAVAPDGTMLFNMHNRVGLQSVEIDPAKKYYKPAGFNGKMKAHYQYIEEGRRPWLYRPGGSIMVPEDRFMPYPRLCVHHGLSKTAPENSLPALGAAVALNAQEIEFDLWATKDEKLVVLHDPTLDRVSNGTGFVWDHTYEELLALDFGGKAYPGLKITTFEEILKKFACTVIMNIHVKIWDMERPDRHYEEIARLLMQYDCKKHAYVTSTSNESLRAFHEIAPEIARCKGCNNADSVRDAVALGCQKVQLFKPYFDQASIDYAHKNGLRCNVFWSDDPEEAKQYLNMGIDTILTNDFLALKDILK